MACPCLHARPLRLVRLARYGHLDRWIGTADLKAAPERFMGSPLPDDLAMCELYISVIKVDFFFLCAGELSEWSQGGDGPTYRLSLAAYHHLLGPTVDIHLARFVGTPHDADAPLWLRRVPTGKLLRWPQPLEFVGMVVGGLTDIPVEPLGGTNEIRMAHWSQDALRIAAPPRRRHIPRRRAAAKRIYIFFGGITRRQCRGDGVGSAGCVAGAAERPSHQRAPRRPKDPRPLPSARRSARLRVPRAARPPDVVPPLRRRPPLRRPQQAPRPPAYAYAPVRLTARAPSGSPPPQRRPAPSPPTASPPSSTSATAARVRAYAPVRPTARAPSGSPPADVVPPLRRRPPLVGPSRPLAICSARVVSPDGAPPIPHSPPPTDEPFVVVVVYSSSPPSRMELSVVNHHHLHVSRAFYAKIRDDWLNTDVRARYYAAYIAATHPCPSSDADLAALNTALKVELGRAARTLAAAYPRYAHDAIGVVYALEVVLDDGRKVFKIGHTMHPSTRLRVLSLCRKRLWGAMWRVPWRIHLETVLHVWFGRAWIGKIRCANCKKRHQEYFDAAACGGRVGVVNAIEGVISLGVKERVIREIPPISADCPPISDDGRPISADIFSAPANSRFAIVFVGAANALPYLVFAGQANALKDLNFTYKNSVLYILNI
ncbi:hypothetical protein GGX14DRAFT_408842 [Mycena pura]|uniref:Bacteriophage T5 Orf172 DNA-binding domain-containing protein n=1 Tax=Mycena pura TaxID=153505 RepID=A0AAD6XZ46_9AGAR|nr:hypothetical protein GGX14DRAFT_408842 [Mycena pura]